MMSGGAADEEHLATGMSVILLRALTKVKASLAVGTPFRLAIISTLVA